METGGVGLGGRGGGCWTKAESEEPEERRNE